MVGAGHEVACALPGTNGEVQRLAQGEEEGGNEGEATLEPAKRLAWLPPTLAAVALRLHALDASLVYSKAGSPARDVLWVRRYSTLQPETLPALEPR